MMRGAESPEAFLFNLRLPLDVLTLYANLSNGVDEAREEQRKRKDKRKDSPDIRYRDESRERMIEGYKRAQDPSLPRVEPVVEDWTDDDLAYFARLNAMAVGKA